MRETPVLIHNRSFRSSKYGAPMFVGNETIAGFDDEIASAIAEETQRQEDHIELPSKSTYELPGYGDEADHSCENGWFLPEQRFGHNGFLIVLVVRQTPGSRGQMDSAA